jgi:hypothetical protein
VQETCRQKKSLKWFFVPVNDYFLAQDRNRELKLVPIEPPGHEDSEYVTKFLYNVFEQNGSEKSL